MFKKAKVVMLPTDEAKLHIQQNKLFWNHVELLHEGEHWDAIKPQHLYVISDEEIKDNDWFIKMNNYSGKPTLYQECKQPFMNSKWLNCPDVIDCFKVIATTDTSLQYAIDKSPYPMEIYGLPQPSQQFINKFISEYNKGNVITDVLVEYDGFICKNGHEMGYKTSCVYPHCDEPNFPKLKIGKDNTITIKRVKDSWSREEVALKLSDFSKDFSLKNNLNFGKSLEYTINWIDKNL